MSSPASSLSTSTLPGYMTPTRSSSLKEVQRKGRANTSSKASSSPSNTPVRVSSASERPLRRLAQRAGAASPSSADGNMASPLRVSALTRALSAHSSLRPATPPTSSSPLLRKISNETTSSSTLRSLAMPQAPFPQSPFASPPPCRTESALEAKLPSPPTLGASWRTYASMKPELPTPPEPPPEHLVAFAQRTLKTMSVSEILAKCPSAKPTPKFASPAHAATAALRSDSATAGRALFGSPVHGNYGHMIASSRYEMRLNSFCFFTRIPEKKRKRALTSPSPPPPPQNRNQNQNC